MAGEAVGFAEQGGRKVSEIFKFGDWTVQNLVDQVDSGVIGLPDLQRPFVWPNTKVRDLFDSMYRGYPVGELMFWNVAAEEETRAISRDAARNAAHQIIDGQQRLTSLYAVIKGKPVRDADYRERSIVIAFNPFTHKFEVPSAAIMRSASWIQNLSEFFASPIPSRRQFIGKFEEANGPLDDEQKDTLETTLSHLYDLRNYLFKVVEILATATKETVADIFVRINSEGVSLKAYDFILTWLSVFWPEGRDEIEDFARASRITAERASELAERNVAWTPRNHFVKVDTGQIIRVLVAIGQNRAKLGDAYNALLARDRATGAVDLERQQGELGRLKSALPLVLKPLHWDEFIRCLPAVGFRSRRMVTSDTNLFSSYAIWLLGRTRYGVDLADLRVLIGRWFYMSQLTSRYTGSGETQLQKDLDRIEQLPAGASKKFENLLESVIASELTEDFWAYRMPDALISSSAALSPSYQCYLAALNVLDADLFMLAGKVREWMDPASTSVKGVEGHHLFPRKYQEAVLGATDVKRINQVANFAPTDWDTNIWISDRPPIEYWPALRLKRSMSDADLERQMYWHALPNSWETLTYDEFLHQRRLLMSSVTRDAFRALSQESLVTTDQENTAAAAFADELDSGDVGELLDGGFLEVGDILVPSDPNSLVEGVILEDRVIQIGDQMYGSLNDAAYSVGVTNVPGLEFWVVDGGSEGRRPVRSDLSQEIAS